MNLEPFAKAYPEPETERLVLRPLSANDAGALHRISNDPPVRRYLWDDEPVSRATIEEIIAQSLRTFSEEGLGLFGVRLRCGEDLTGFCGFARLEGMDEIELAYELAPELWGRGLATGAARACLRHAGGGPQTRDRRSRPAQRRLFAHDRKARDEARRLLRAEP